MKTTGSSSVVGRSTVNPSHDDLVRDICRQVVARDGRRLTVRKPHADHTPRAVDYKSDCHPVDVSRLTRVLEIRTGDGNGESDVAYAHCEGLVTMGQLVTVALEFGYLPACSPEFRAFTVAGLINGRGVQSSSHKFGLFEIADNCLEMEVVLGDGSVVVCDPNRHADLYHRLGGCYGTLGIVTAAKVRLVPATKMVQCRHTVFTNIQDFADYMKSRLEQPHFLDGVVFARDHAVAIEGDFVDAVPPGDEAKVFHPLYPQQPGGMFYYQYVREATKGKTTHTDYIPTKEYAHRSERGLWWFAEAMAIDKQLMKMSGTRERMEQELKDQYENHGFRIPVLTESEQRRTVVAQDQGFQIDRVAERLHWSIDHFGILPIWVCYVRISEHQRVGKFQDCTHLTDIGLYGIPSVPSYRSHEVIRQWQLSADEPVAWGELYLTADEADDRIGEFGPELRALRNKYKAESAFKSIRDKITFHQPGEADTGPPMAFFRSQLMWRQSKALFLTYWMSYPLIKIGSLVDAALQFPATLAQVLLRNAGFKKLKNA